MEIFNSTLEYFKQGGFIMIPLAVGSLFMWALIFERFNTFRSLTSRDITIQESIQAIRTGRLEPSHRGLRARLVRRFLAERSGSPGLDREILRQCALEIRPTLDYFLAVIAVLASIAPLLGLLGTVLGMIETFDVISIFGTGNAKAMAGGISVALVTTQTGLLIAIPGLFVSGLLFRRSSRLKTQLDEITSILDRNIRNLQTKKAV